MEGVKFGEWLNFGDWRILIWPICGHVPHNGSKWQISISVNGYQNVKFAKFSYLQNFLLYGNSPFSLTPFNDIHILRHAHIKFYSHFGWQDGMVEEAEWSESKDNSLSRASLDDLAISIES